MSIGRGLDIGGSGASTKRAPPVKEAVKCPQILEMRQLLQYKPIGEEARHNLSASLRSYCEALIERDAIDAQMIYPSSDADSRTTVSVSRVNVSYVNVSACHVSAMRYTRFRNNCEYYS